MTNLMVLSLSNLILFRKITAEDLWSLLEVLLTC